MENIVVVIAVTVFIIVILWAVNGVNTVAERKLGRPLTIAETILGTMTAPYSIIYVLWVMPEPKRKSK